MALGGGLGYQGDRNICCPWLERRPHLAHPVVRASVVGSHSSAFCRVVVYLNKKKDGMDSGCSLRECG